MSPASGLRVLSRRRQQQSARRQRQREGAVGRDQRGRGERGRDIDGYEKKSDEVFCIREKTK